MDKLIDLLYALEHELCVLWACDTDLELIARHARAKDRELSELIDTATKLHRLKAQAAFNAYEQVRIEAFNVRSQHEKSGNTNPYDWTSPTAAQPAIRSDSNLS